uniref:PHD finger protein 20, a n=1 Tax=Cyprinus carpio TaxID=7962 RepID=A0A8C1ICC6_CYPCA
MSKMPPNRRGIKFEVGAALEARDSLKNWYTATIEKIDYENEKVLIHYRQWSHRYNEWFEWASPYLRPMERVQLRREGRQEDSFIPGFHVNDKVLASWSDCRFYPAKVLAVNKDASYTVKFYDGVIQTVKGIHVKPFTKERRKKLTDKNGETPMLKKTDKDKTMQEEHGVSSAKQAAGQTDHVPEKEEDEISDLDREEGEQKKSSGNGTCLKVENISILEQVGQHNYSKSFLKKVSGPEEGEEEAAVKMEDSVVFHSGMNFNEEMVKRNETEEAEVQVEQKKEEIKGQCLPHDRKSQRQRIRRKRRLSMARRSSKKTKTESEKSFHNDSKSTFASTSQEKGPDPLHLTQSSNGTAVPKAQCQSETFKPTAVRKQAFHNPNRFSREPLYRVIRNQPPPVLSINLDHNPYKCSVSGCTKSFRKAKLLHYHMKYYHGDDRLIEQDQTRATDKHTTLNNQDSSKKRCITSHECVQMSVKRRSLALPVVSAQSYQRWPSLKDKTRENQLDSNMHRYFNKERERRSMEMDEDSISDWSSDSCGWSEDAMGADLDVIASPLSCSSVASTTGSQETVRCVCEVEEENDFMLQCEECLYWQHGTCMGLLEENVPVRYACFICRDSPGQIRGQRQRLRYWYDRDWLTTGHMYGLSFLENYSHKNGKKIAATHQLLGDVQHVVEVLKGLQLKISVLQSQSHPDLKLWRQPWKLTEKSRMKTMALPDTKTVSASASLDAIQLKEPLTSSFQDYISSEHCYQKPQTLYQVLEPRLVLKTRVESVLEDRLHNTETVLKNDQQNNGEIQPALLKTSSTQLFNHSMDVGEKREAGADGGGVKGGAQQQWKISLLEHIETMQEEVTQRMDFIERELDVLENWLDCTGELEPPEPLDRLPELKHSIKQLLNEMGKVQQIALTCAT